jgi:hypothetical protein
VCDQIRLTLVLLIGFRDLHLIAFAFETAVTGIWVGWILE